MKNLDFKTNFKLNFLSFENLEKSDWWQMMDLLMANISSKDLNRNFNRFEVGIFEMWKVDFLPVLGSQFDYENL